MKLPEPLPSISGDYTEWEKIIKASGNPDIQAKIRDVEKDYPYWEQFRHKVKELPEGPATLWQLVSSRRNSTAYLFTLTPQVPDFVFKYNTTNTILQQLHHFDMNMGGILEGGTIIPPEDKSKYLISSVMEEAIASSQLEGASTTREVAKQMLRENKTPKNQSEKMILNNYVTMRHMIDRKEEKLTPQLIREIHGLITKNTLDNPANEGQFRNNDDVNVVDYMSNEIVYSPPSHVHLDHLMERFCAFANEELEEADFIHPIIRAILLHFLIGYIHPFVDGNGRTARAIFYWYLVKKKYWLAEYMSISRIILQAPAQYARSYLYTEYDHNDTTYFLKYNLKCMELALKSLQIYIKRKLMEKEDWIHLIRHEQINERQAELLRTITLQNKNMYTIREVQSIFDVVYQTARTDLMGLAELGYLEEKKQGKKILYFKSKNFNEKIDRLRKEE